MKTRGSGGTGGARPVELTALLDIREAAARDRAWWAFLRAYGTLLFEAAASFKGQSDLGSRYGCALAELRRNDFSHLRSYHGAATFTTWLVALGRRLAVLHERGQCLCGAGAGVGPVPTESGDEDRRLIEALAERLDLKHMADPTGTNPERQLRFRLICDHLAEIVDRLSVRARLLLALRFVDGRSNGKVARVMGLPTAYRARREVAQVLRTIRDGL